MTSRWWCPSPFDRMHERAFKRVPEGWIFRAPNPWLFGPRRHYLIDQAQKSELSIHLRQVYRVVERALIIIVAIAVPVALVLNDNHPVMTFPGLVVGAAAIGFVVIHLAVTHMYRAVQPLMAALQPTTQRSTQGFLETQLAIHSRGRLAYYCLSSLVLFAVVLFALLSSRIWSGGNLLWLVSAIILGSAPVYWFLLYIAKVRSER